MDKPFKHGGISMKKLLLTTLSLLSLSSFAGPQHTAAAKGDIEELWKAIGEEIGEEAEDSQITSFIDSEDENGNTCLSLATRNGHFEMIEELIALDADVNHCNKLGARPIHIAAWEGPFGHGFEPIREEEKNENGGFDPKKSEAYKLTIINLLVENGANINDVEERDNRETPLSIAVNREEKSIVKYLREKGAMVSDDLRDCLLGINGRLIVFDKKNKQSNFRKRLEMVKLLRILRSNS